MGKPFLKIVPPEGNLLYKVAKCVCVSIPIFKSSLVHQRVIPQYSIKMKTKCTGETVDHWLDHSKAKYGDKLVEDLKKTFNVLFMFLPMPIFWALVDQIGSTWTFQARRMNGDIGVYNILPDQMQFANPLLYLSWIPISEYFLYPAFHRMKILRTTLQKVTFGGVVTALAFICSACVSLALEATYPTLPSAGNGQIRIYNTLPCDVEVTTDLTSSGSVFIAHGDYYKNVDLKLEGNETRSYFVTGSCANFSGRFEVFESVAVGYYFESSGARLFRDEVSKQEQGLPRVRYEVFKN